MNLKKLKDSVSNMMGGSDKKDESSKGSKNLTPYGAFGFKVVLSKLSGEQMGLFQEVSGLSVQVNVKYARMALELEQKMKAAGENGEWIGANAEASAHKAASGK